VKTESCKTERVQVGRKGEECNRGGREMSKSTMRQEKPKKIVSSMSAVVLVISLRHLARGRDRPLVTQGHKFRGRT
jgi:hypothetical protein